MKVTISVIMGSLAACGLLSSCTGLPTATNRGYSTAIAYNTQPLTTFYNTLPFTNYYSGFYATPFFQPQPYSPSPFYYYQPPYNYYSPKSIYFSRLQPFYNTPYRQYRYRYR